jgi:hypothetical protein
MTFQTKDGEKAIPVGKIDINLANPNQIIDAINNRLISPEVKERLKMRHKQVVESGYMVAKATFFSPDLLPNNKSVSTSYSAQPPYTTTYYTYNGSQMKSEQLFYDNLDTQYQVISSGSLAKNIADNICNLAVIAVTKIKYVNFFTTAISLYDAFANAYGASWATGATNDYVQVKLIYDNTDQWTYRNINGDWYLGLVSQKAVISNIASVQYYYNKAKLSGKTFERSRNVSVTHKSSDFDSPWAVAYQWCNNHVNETLSWQCGGVLFYF